MAEIFGALGALAVIVAPLGLAAWLLARTDRRRSRGKMPRHDQRKTDAD
ncbi:MAG: hypothetical protein KA151_04790 [Piscinibacter sp.]|nr:hypothetical protein [Piscinibacter sp.]